MTVSQATGRSAPSRVVQLLAARRVRYLIFAAIAVLYAGCIGYLWIRGVADLFDFNDYYMAAYGFSHDVDIYAMGDVTQATYKQRWDELASAAGVEHFSSPYLYPPLTAQLVAPLLRFPPLLAGTIWLTLSAMTLLVATWWLGKQWTQPEGASIVYLLMLGFVPPIIALREGQIGGFLLLALVAALAGVVHRNAPLVGSALAIAAQLKFIPIVLCLYLGWRKQWVASAIVAVVIIGLVLTVLPMFGVEVLESYVVNFQHTARAGLVYPKLANQGISGFWARVLLPNVESIIVYRTYLLSVVVMVVATIIICWPMRSMPTYGRYEFALIVCALLLIPPFTWYHMLTLLLIPLVLMVEYLWRKQHWRLLTLLGVLYLATDVHGVLYRYVEIPRWLSSFPLVMVLFTWGVLAWMIVDARRVEAGKQALA